MFELLYTVSVARTKGQRVMLTEDMKTLVGHQQIAGNADLLTYESGAVILQISTEETFYMFCNLPISLEHVDHSDYDVLVHVSHE